VAVSHRRQSTFVAGTVTFDHLADLRRHSLLVHSIRESFAKKPASLEAAVHTNARASAAYLLAHSRVLRDAVESKRVLLVVAYYHLDSGLVERLK
jgi:carbonic anhydrase